MKFKKGDFVVGNSFYDGIQIVEESKITAYKEEHIKLEDSPYRINANQFKFAETAFRDRILNLNAVVKDDLLAIQFR